jgi:hypothetical protein
VRSANSAASQPFHLLLVIELKTLKITVLYIVKACRLSGSYRRFGGIYCPYIQGKRISREGREVIRIERKGNRTLLRANVLYTSPLTPVSSQRASVSALPSPLTVLVFRLLKMVAASYLETLLESSQKTVNFARLTY